MYSRKWYVKIIHYLGCGSAIGWGSFVYSAFTEMADMDTSTDSEPDFEQDELEATVRVLNHAQDFHARVSQACSLILEFLDDDDDRAPDGIEDFSVDPLCPAVDYFQHIMSGHESPFYRVIGFTIDEWEVTTTLHGHNQMPHIYDCI